MRSMQNAGKTLPDRARFAVTLVLSIVLSPLVGVALGLSLLAVERMAR